MVEGVALGGFLPAGSFLSVKCTTDEIAEARVVMGAERWGGRFTGPLRVVLFSEALQCTSVIRFHASGLVP